jgi:hypothetical protein
MMSISHLKPQPTTLEKTKTSPDSIATALLNLYKKFAVFFTKWPVIHWAVLNYLTYALPDSN